MAAWPLVQRGIDVLMLERGPWVDRGPENWAPEGTLTNTPYFHEGRSFVAESDGGPRDLAACSCVGGPSVFYGGVSLRFREEDFRPDQEITTDSGAQWPFDYQTLQPYYAKVEGILQVAGAAGVDPTEPPRESPYTAAPAPLSPVSQRISTAAASMGLRPFRLPLAINYGARPQGRECIACGTCDTFACGIGAKNDLAVQVIPTLLRQGMELGTETEVTRLTERNGRVAAVQCTHRVTGERLEFTADSFVLAAGALATPYLLLTSGLEALNSAGDSVGRYLTRHCSGIVFGAYPGLPKHEGRFHKQVGINDYYFGHPQAGDSEAKHPRGKLGNIQQTQTPSIGTVRTELSSVASFFLTPLVRRITGLLVIAEDRPRYDNRVRLNPSVTDTAGNPGLVVEHNYSQRDLDARRALGGRAKAIHRKAGALGHYMHEIDTFSHALGTVRMGSDEARDPLDDRGRFRGLENLYVTDGAALPTSAGVNPSLTIAANAMRIGQGIAELWEGLTHPGGTA
ncbi:MAG: GMC oxidoreductase [Longimicrobiales bacterium]